MPRPKFYRLYGPCQLRVEQIGPNLWHGSVYEAQYTIWDRFTCLDEACVKNCAVVTVKNMLENRRAIVPALEGDWSNDSDRPDAEWKRELARLGFPGYIEREGLETFKNLGRFDAEQNFGR